MVRPERRVLLASESLVRAGARAPGSRPQPNAEMPRARAGRQKSVLRRAKKRAATLGERCISVRLSAERCLGGPSRSCHGEDNRQQPGRERLLDLPGVLRASGPLDAAAGGRRKGWMEKWSHDRFVAMGLYRLRGTVKYPTQATQRRSSLSRVQENCTHGLKGVC